MAKKKSSKKSSSNLISLIITIAVILFAVLTICTLFMPVITSTTLLTKLGVSATGGDVISAMFASEASIEMSEGTMLLYGYKIAEDTAFVTTLFMWLYFLTVLVSVAVVVFAVLRMLGLKFKLVNIVLGSALLLLALLTFIFAIVVASQNTNVTTVLNTETGIRASIAIGVYLLIGTLLAGGAHTYQARQK